ncbi:MAG: sodium:solute symporter family protein, partial [Clostridia bacterium]|nr:sodium:solute symporter family protein [Clostridia bacterium]
SQFKAGGLLAETLFGWNHVTAVIIFAIGVCIYTAIGGLLAVAWNDTFNLCFGTIGVIVVLVAGLSKIGGFEAISATMTPERLDPRPFGSWVWAVDYLASSTFVMLAVPELIQRIWGCKTDKVARNACMIGGVLYIVLGLASLTLGLIAFVVLPNIDAGLAMPELVMYLFPNLFGVIIILAVLAALVSTADTMLLICSNMIVEDLIKPFRKQPMTDKQNMVLLRAFIFIVAAITVLFATGFDRVLGLVLFSYYVYIGISTIFIFGRLWKGATENAAFWSMIISFVFALLWQFTSIGANISWLTTGIVATLTSVIPFFVISWIENASNKKNGVIPEPKAE